MLPYIARRLALLPAILFGVTALVFALAGQLSPGQRAALYVSDLPRSPAAVQRVIDRYGLEDPLPAQYARWLGQLARGNLGFSTTGKEPVARVIARLLPATLELALWACLPIVWVGVRLGILAAVRHGGRVDQALRVCSTVGTSVPLYLVGLAAIMLFAARLDWLPAGDRLSPALQIAADGPDWRAPTGMHTVDALVNGRGDVWLDAVRHLVLPVLSLAIVSWAYLLRVTRSSMLEALGQDYVRTALAKGVPRPAAIHAHAWPNARLPVAALTGLTLVGLLGGVAIVETVFNWPGLGNRFVQAAVSLDVVTTLGLTLFGAVTVVLGNLVVDVASAWLDPRIRLS